MYCLKFTEIGLESKNFFYHSFIKAVELERQLLIIEINNIITFETDEEPFIFDVVSNNVVGECRYEKMTNHDLYRLFLTLIKIAYKDEWEHHLINIEIDEIKFKDKIEIGLF
jgi:hypothetical protein